MQQQIDHPFYLKSPIEEADAVAWVATHKECPLKMYPFKFLPLEPTDVRLKVLYTSICQSDIMTIREHWGPCNYPNCPGHEIVGEITMVGESVTTLKVGDKVGVSPVRYSCLNCRYCKLGHTQMCQERIYLYGDGFFGGYCSHVQIDHNWAIKVPAGLDLKQLPPLLCAGVTMFAPLRRFQKVGANCAVLGIGGLGHVGIQFANKMGMRVTAFTTRLHTIDALRKLGAADASHSTNKESLKKQEGKYDVVISTLYIEDPELYQLHQRLTKPGGVHIMVGVPDNAAVYQLDTEYLVNNEITLAGSNVGSINEVADMMQFAADYGVQSVNEHFSFEDFPKALHRAEKEHPHYRCVINVTDWAKKNGFDK